MSEESKQRQTRMCDVKANIEAVIEDHFRADEIAQTKFVEAINVFKTQVWKKLSGVTAGIKEVHDLIKGFEAEHKERMGELVIFEKGVQAYANLLKLDADQISQLLEGDLKRILLWIEHW